MSMIGKTLAHYEITSQLGKGGMGEVYQAKDRKLGRDVAIKVLPEEFARDTDRVARFQREAKLLASLNHPNIAAIHGLEESGGTNFLVLELVEGETLADQLKRGPIPVEESLNLALQIAEALEAAHGKGVIHRDLKPANIKVTSDGKVKVLDFGLAKAYAGDQEANLSNSPTLSNMATQQGAILGTAAYMSPEQAKGRETDKRSDVWAFGCVLCEMLTGKQVFEGGDVSDIMAAVLRADPDWRSLPHDTPPALRRLLRLCLRKDRNARIPDIAIARFELDEMIREPQGEAVGQRAKTTFRRRFIAVCIAVLCLACAATGVAVYFLTRPAPLPVTRFDIMPAAPAAFTTMVTGVNIALSPDGRSVAYHVRRGSSIGLDLRRFDESEARALPSTEEARHPAFSPDGKSIAFIKNSKLQKLALDTKSAVELCDVFNDAGISWMNNETIVFAQSGSKGGLYRVAATGGKPERLAAPDSAKGEQSYQHPCVTPDGKAVLFSIRPAGSINLASNRIAIRSLTSGEQKVLIEGAYYPRVSSGGRLFYIRGDQLMAVGFDSQKFKTSGDSVVLREGIRTKGNGVAEYDIANDGTFVCVPGAGGIAYASRFIWKNRSGATIGYVFGDQLDYPRYPRISPDGRQAAVTIGPSNEGNIWIYDLQGARQPRKLTFKGHNTFAMWSPDGTRVAFRSVRDGSREYLYWIPSDGSATEPELLLGSDYPTDIPTWSPDGKWFMYVTENPQIRNILDLWILPMSGERKPRLWSPTSFTEGEPSFSLDSRWVAYVSDQTGQPEIWVRPFPGPGAPTRVSPAGGHDPVWSRTGKELFYQEGTRLMASEVSSAGSEIRFGTPHMLFDGGFIPFQANTPRTYDVAADGRFLMVEQTASYFSQHLTVVLNWLEELKQRVPIK